MKIGLNSFLEIRLRGKEKFLSVKGSLKFPLKDIVSVSTATPQSSWKEIRAPGSFIPGLIKAGTYYTDRGKEFWYTTRGKKLLTIELQGQSYKRVVVGLDNPEQWKKRLNSRLNKLLNP